MTDGMRTRFGRVVDELLDTDERVAVVYAVIGTREFGAAGRRHVDRVVDVGIREQAMVGVAAGMALEGFRPIVHSYAPFLVERPYEQIKLDFAHQGVGGVFVSIGASYDAAASGRTHQAPEDVALMATIPGMQIHVPGHPDEVEALLRRIVPGEGLHYVRLSTKTNARALPADGSLKVVRGARPWSPTVVAVGPMIDPVLEATSGLDVGVVGTTTVRPLDGDALRGLAGADVILVEPMLEGTSLPAVTAALADRPRRYLAIGVPAVEHRRYGTADEHDRAHGLDAEGLRRRITAFVA